MLTLAVVSGVLCLGVSVLFGQQRQAPQTIEPGSSCLAQQCHANLRSGPFVHGPLSEGDDACELCHEADGKNHSFSYPATGAELCYNCHDSVTKKKLTHAPLEDKEDACTICHNPHSSANEKLLNSKTINELCLSCHDEVAQGGMYHDAEKIEGCTSCHEPHSSDIASLLSAKSPDLCYSCHSDLKDTITQAAMVHGPVSMGCDTCHQAHKKLAGKGLAKAVPDLCVDCHEDFKPTVAEMSIRHHLLLEGKKCARCHDPHASKAEYLLLGNTQSLCLSCHAKKVKSADGRVIANLKEVLAKDVHLHGLGQSLDCAACHQPHANKQFRFLRGPYPQKFYSPYSDQIYGLCFICHDKSLAVEAQTDEATEFRDGSKNLHYLHVNKKKKGRTCRACHAWHVSKNPQLLRESVPFGEWQIPINFTATQNGGSCGPGCHQAKTYSRTNVVVGGRHSEARLRAPSTSQPLPETSTGISGSKASNKTVDK
ncbi:MAG: hypothetical protein GWP14_02515 [Actinobacteria bacterium]|nr:hypothetical protein [Actinomycetota bacterium]